MFRYVLVETAVITRTKKSDTHAHLIKVTASKLFERTSEGLFLSGILGHKKRNKK